MFCLLALMVFVLSIPANATRLDLQMYILDLPVHDYFSQSFASFVCLVGFVCDMEYSASTDTEGKHRVIETSLACSPVLDCECVVSHCLAGKVVSHSSHLFSRIP